VNNKSIPSEKMIVNLLKDLSADNKPYPQRLLEARRAAYISQVALVIGSGPHFHKGNGPGQGGSASTTMPMTTAMKVVLTALIAGNIALATYLGVSIYNNWDKVQAWLIGGTSVSETSPAPLVISTEAPEIAVSPESSVMPDSTPEPTGLSEDYQPSGGDSVSNPQGGTPKPGGGDKPGLRLGNTPHGPDNPPGNDNQDNTQDNNKGNQDKEKNKP